MKKVIISGAAGFIGNAVARLLADKGIEVIAIVPENVRKCEEAWRLKDLPATIIECDIENIEKLSEKPGIVGADTFYQFAWSGLKNKDLLDYNKQIQNIKCMMDSIVTAAKLGCKKFIGAGTITQGELLTEAGIYFHRDKHKYFRTAQLACEYMGMSVAYENKIEFIWPIIINIYGEGEKSPRLINTMIRNLQTGKRQSASEGKQIYDFLHIDDAANAFYLIGEKGTEKRRYVIGSGQPKPLRSYLEIVRNIIAPEAEIGWGEIPYMGIQLPDEMYDIQILQKDTGFKPKVTFEEGIMRTAGWMKENE